MGKVFSFGKKEKLKSRKQLAELFGGKQSFFLFPLKVFYLEPSQVLDNNIKVGVGTNTRNFKKAVDRNRIKRLLREAYRIYKLPLHEHLAQNNKQLVVFFLYVDKLLPQKEVLQSKMPQVIKELIKRLNENVSQNT